MNKAKFIKSSFKFFLILHKSLLDSLFFREEYLNLLVKMKMAKMRVVKTKMEKNEENNKADCIPLHHHAEFVFLLPCPHKHFAFWIICTRILSFFFIELYIPTNNKPFCDGIILFLFLESVHYIPTKMYFSDLSSNFFLLSSRIWELGMLSKLSNVPYLIYVHSKFLEEFDLIILMMPVQKIDSTFYGFSPKII